MTIQIANRRITITSHYHAPRRNRTARGRHIDPVVWCGVVLSAATVGLALALAAVGG